MSFRQSRGLPVPSLYIMIHEYLKTENTMTILEHMREQLELLSKSMGESNFFDAAAQKAVSQNRRQAVQQPAVNVPSGEPVEGEAPGAELAPTEEVTIFDPGTMSFASLKCCLPRIF